MQGMIDEAVELYRRRRFLEEVNAAYMPLRQDAETWEAVEREQGEWDIALSLGTEYSRRDSGRLLKRHSRSRCQKYPCAKVTLQHADSVMSGLFRRSRRRG